MSELEQNREESLRLHAKRSAIQEMITHLTLQRNEIDEHLWRLLLREAAIRMELLRESDPEAYIALTTPLPLGSAAKKRFRA